MPTTKRRKATKSPVNDPLPQHPRCDKCHHLPFGTSAFIALMCLITVTLSMFVLTSLSLIEKQDSLISALQIKVGSLAQK